MCAPAERADTFSLFLLYPYVYSVGLPAVHRLYPTISALSKETTCALGFVTAPAPPPPAKILVESKICWWLENNKEEPSLKQN